MKSHPFTPATLIPGAAMSWAAFAKRWLLTMFVGSSAIACGAQVEPIDPANSQTHWLEGCDSNAECGDLECLCGVCTSGCTSNTQCAELDNDAVCGTGGDRCAALTSNPICTLACTDDDDCPNDGKCDNGMCSVANEPTGAQPGGAACDVDDDCASGVCEGQGCDAFEGTCAEEGRVCDADARAYCGCDGTTFYGGGGCPGERYEFEGECDASSADAGTPVSPDELPVGELCNSDGQCASGLCRSETCFAEDARCIESTQSPCLANIVQFCGCDGVTLTGSSGGYGCAPAPYAYVGACGNGTQPAGDRCNVNEDCASGLCEGQGCGAFEGRCADENRPCTSDIVSYCGCDGTTIVGSSSCPGGRYENVGECGTSPTDEQCEGLPESTCILACNPVYGIEVDGSARFVACSATPLTTLEAYVCVASPDGDLLQLPQAHVPDDWMTADMDECEPDCFSPFRNSESAGSPDAVGCECTSMGAACIDGIGMECFDPTDDLNPTRYWNVRSDVCDVDLETCESGYRLQQCLDRFQSCVENGVVLDVGTPVFCGAPALDCGQRDEAGCDGDCSPVWGVSRTSSSAYAGCLAAGESCTDEEPQTYCIQRLTPQTAVGDGDPVLVRTCTVPSGWAQMELEYCADAMNNNDCVGRSEEQCTAPCGVRMGRVQPDGLTEFVGCDTGECPYSSTVCAQNANGEVVEFFGCALPGWAEIDSGNCTLGLL